MRILQVVSTPPYAWATGGTSRVVFELSRELAVRGHDVTLLTTDLMKPGIRHPRKTSSELLEGVRVKRFANLSNTMAWKYKMYIAPGILLFLKRHLPEYDMVHLQDILSFQAIATSRYCKAYSVPYVLSTHGSAYWFRQGRTMDDLLFNMFGSGIVTRASKLIAVARSEAEQQKALGVSEDRIVLIPNGLDLRRFENMPDKGTFRKSHGLGSYRIVLYLGRIHKRKGLDFLIRAFNLLRLERDDCMLVIAGPDDGFKREAQKLAGQLGMVNRIRFVGYIENDLEAYVDADILVYPAIHEIFGLVPFEAVMSGTPVIVTDDCGCGELVEEAKCGYMVRYGDVIDLKVKMSRLLDEGGNEMVRVGKEFISTFLSWPNVADRMEHVYESIS